ncbi:MAG: aminotransferase class IV family protein [Magnetospirillum gryphiswaldense]|nr:aminotransferase class IV family protein [Magnetospirillum gryphiswaldense]
MKLMLNGQLVDSGAPFLQAHDRGFTLGDGLFETIKIRHGQPLRLDLHLARLQQGAVILRLPLPPGEDWLGRAIHDVLQANDMHDAALRLTVSRGPGQRGLLPPDPCVPTILLTPAPLPPPLGPARAVTAQNVRRNQMSPLSRIKALSYLDNVLARLEAQDHGADDAVLLNTLGRVAETTIANIFVVGNDGILVTPPVADGALPGVRRAEMLRSMVAIERSISREDLLNAREVFLTNALSVRPLIIIDGHMVGDGHPGPLGRRLSQEAENE